LDKDKQCGDLDYAYEVEFGERNMTVLHMAASRNLSTIINIMLKYHPDIIYTTSRCMSNMPQMNALETALEKRNDDACALLISKMDPKRYGVLKYNM